MVLSTGIKRMAFGEKFSTPLKPFPSSECLREGFLVALLADDCTLAPLTAPCEERSTHRPPNHAAVNLAKHAPALLQQHPKQRAKTAPAPAPQTACPRHPATNLGKTRAPQHSTCTSPLAPCRQSCKNAPCRQSRKESARTVTSLKKTVNLAELRPHCHLHANMRQHHKQLPKQHTLTAFAPATKLYAPYHPAFNLANHFPLFVRG